MKKIMVIALCLFLLTGCGSHTKGDYPATIMVEGMLYYSTDHAISINEEEYDIQYSTSYAEDGVPEKNGETNFDRNNGVPYIVLEDKIIVKINKEWIEFQAE